MKIALEFEDTFAVEPKTFKPAVVLKEEDIEPDAVRPYTQLAELEKIGRGEFQKTRKNRDMEPGEPGEMSCEEFFGECDKSARSTASEKFARTAALRKKLYDYAIAAGKLKPADDLAQFLGGSEREARAAIRRIAA